jgi:hypothetical protein
VTTTKFKKFSLKKVCLPSMAIIFPESSRKLNSLSKQLQLHARSTDKIVRYVFVVKISNTDTIWNTFINLKFYFEDSNLQILQIST